MVLNPHMRVVALAGGVGGAKLALGLSRVLPPEQLAIVGNVADDFELYGLHISPDLDTVMYTLAGVANPATGWGIDGDTRQMLGMLARYGEDTWFGLGDKDLATHLLRTQWLAAGMTLTTVTRRLMTALGAGHDLLPVTDDPLATMVDTVEHGTLGFQEYFVRHRWQPTVTRIWFQGAQAARLSPAVQQALDRADVVVVCPSNPVLSIAPILSVPGMRDALRAGDKRCVAVSPFIGGEAVKGPASKLMAELDLDISPRGLVSYYDGLLDGLVVDAADKDAPRPDAVPVLVTRTLMQTDEDKIQLATEVLRWVGSLS